jgi:phosphatidyl-myo-inositol dimannoside synthase
LGSKAFKLASPAASSLLKVNQVLVLKRSNSAPTKALLILPEAFNCAGGIQMFCRALCLAAGRWAQSNSASVSALVLNDDITPDARYVGEGFSSYVGTGKSKVRFIRYFLRYLLISKYDWIIFGHVSLSPLSLLTRLLSSEVKIGVVTYGIEVWRPLSTVQRKALRQADLVLAISEYTKAELIKHTAVPAEKIKIFPCTLDPYWKVTSSITKLECTPPVLLSVTRMNREDRYKGIDSVIKSIPAIVSKAGPVEYRVIGQGDDLPRLRALAAGLGVARYVNFVGGVSDAELREQYQRCSLFVMPSKKEGFGIVFLEAMAYGKPVVGGAHGGTPSVVKEGETGLLIDGSNIAAIADSVTQLLRNKAMREKFGHAGRQRLLDKFTFDKFERNLNAALNI